ncbi:MAG: transcription initiation factor IIB [Candidatus Bathyarchaeota archaeon]|nr:transcription initiation factor IIB [Candidatus Bathyarchaeota archaeon]
MTQQNYIQSEAENIHQCSACKSTNLIEDVKTGEIICSKCGLVVVERGYSLNQDWRAYSFQEHNDRSRSGYALSNKIFDKGLSTTFHSGYDSKGKKLDPETMDRMNRLKKQDQRTKINDTWQRNLKIALSEMSRVCNELHLPDHIHEQAAHTYRRVLKEDLVRGRSIDGFVAASIYAACRTNKLPRSIKDIAGPAHLTEHEVKYYYRLLVKELGFKTPIDRPAKFISSLSSKLKLNGRVEVQSIKILDKAREMNLIVGKNPRGVAAAVLYLACQEVGVNITQAELARAASTSEVTMRKRFKEYEPILQSLKQN